MQSRQFIPHGAIRFALIIVLQYYDNYLIRQEEQGQQKKAQRSFSNVGMSESLFVGHKMVAYPSQQQKNGEETKPYQDNEPNSQKMVCLGCRVSSYRAGGN